MKLLASLMALVAVFGLSLPATAAVPPGYVVTDLGTLQTLPTCVPPQTPSTDACVDLPSSSFGYGLNNSGHVIGYSENGVDIDPTAPTGVSVAHTFLHDGTSMQDLGVLNAGDTLSVGLGLNETDQAVGFSESATADTAFVYAPASGMTPLPALTNQTSSQAYALNNNGQVVGFATVQNGVDPVTLDPLLYDHAFLYQLTDPSDPTVGGVISEIPILDSGTNNYANSVNDNGQVVGYSWTQVIDPATGLPIVDPVTLAPALFDHAFFYDIATATLKDLGTLTGGTNSYATSINLTGHIVGYSLAQDAAGTPDMEEHVFECVYDSVTDTCPLTDLGTFPDGAFSRAYDINDNGDIIGYGTRLDPVTMFPDYLSHAFVYDSTTSTIHDLNDLIPPGSGWELTSAEAINNKGQITGYGTHNSEPRAFLLTPDSDGDGVGDTTDNCTLVPNADQRDTNGDGFGNICDPDVDNNNTTNIDDLTQMLGLLNSSDPDSDLDGNGTVNIDDLLIALARLNQAPGPSGLVP